MNNIDKKQKIIRLFVSGVPGPIIGKEMGISRERVRQILCKAGIKRQDGGNHKRAADRAIDRSRRKADRWVDKLGCYYWQYKDIQNRSQRQALKMFMHQKRNAHKRGVAFNLNLPEWWGIWEDSGHFLDRGKKMGQYVMARNGDNGPYEVGNVKIISSSENHKEARKFKTWSRPYKALCPRGHKKDKTHANGHKYCSVCMAIAHKKYIEKKRLAL